jgi:hypothetical protein
MACAGVSRLVTTIEPRGHGDPLSSHKVVSLLGRHQGIPQPSAIDQ